jgi:hypothetical protein
MHQNTGIADSKPAVGMNVLMLSYYHPSMELANDHCKWGLETELL